MNIDRQQADFLLRTLDYDDWLTAALVFPPKSMVKQSIRSLEQLQWLLQPSANSFPSVQLTKMTEWVEQAVGDRELASELTVICQEQKSYKARCLAAYDRIKTRCEQLRTGAQEVENG